MQREEWERSALLVQIYFKTFSASAPACTEPTPARSSMKGKSLLMLGEQRSRSAICASPGRPEPVTAAFQGRSTCQLVSLYLVEPHSSPFWQPVEFKQLDLPLQGLNDGLHSVAENAQVLFSVLMCRGSIPGMEDRCRLQWFPPCVRVLAASCIVIRLHPCENWVNA